ncbi:MAG TPA: hypothetical protein VFF52_21980 [Isosphaeraceae bacterium]|nr:hypothetical protein [Isosphaeraceae bacterium]
MADTHQDTEPPKTEAEKKQSETVHLTAEELRKISGGATAGNPTPVPANKQVYPQ